MGHGLWATSCLGGTKKKQQPIGSRPNAELSDSTGQILTSSLATGPTQSFLLLSNCGLSKA